MTTRVLVTRAAGQAQSLEAALREQGLEPVAVPAIAVEIDRSGGELDDAMRVLRSFDWVVVTSPNGARAVLMAAERVLTDLETPRWAAIGDGTAAILEASDIRVAFKPSRPEARGLADELPVTPGDEILLLRGDLSGEDLPAHLRDRGATVRDVIAYRTTEGPSSSRPILRAAFAAGSPNAVLLASGSAARGLVALAEAEGLDVDGIPAVCIGLETQFEATRLGYQVLATSPGPDPATFAATAAMALAQPLETR